MDRDLDRAADDAIRDTQNRDDDIPDTLSDDAADATTVGAGGAVAKGVIGSSAMANEPVGTLAGAVTGSLAADDIADTPVEDERIEPIDFDALDKFSSGGPADTEQQPPPEGDEIR